MKDLTRLFAGITDRASRDWLSVTLPKIRERYPRAHLACCGEFTDVKLCLAAGYKPENIVASDISPYSAVIGAILSGTPMADVPFIIPPAIEDEYAAAPHDLDRAALVFWAMKIAQIKPNSSYNRQYIRDLEDQKAKHVAKFRATLAAMREDLGGIRYETRDARELVEQTDDPELMVLLNPPLYRGGYDRMFAGDLAIGLSIKIPQLDWAKEYLGLYEATRRSRSLWIWGCAGPLPDSIRMHVMFSRQSSARWEHWLCCRRQEMEDLGVKAGLSYKPTQDPFGVGRTVPVDYRITPASRVTFHQVEKPVALYYRDVFAHKMGSTRAELYYLMLLDGMVFGVVGFVMRDVARLVENKVGEVFGFNKGLVHHPAANRLLMMAITCRDMRAVLVSASRRNRVFELTGLKTACFSKYRTLKLNRGLLKVVGRKKLKNGQYQIHYATDFYDRSFQDCVQQYLQDERGRGEPAVDQGVAAEETSE